MFDLGEEPVSSRRDRRPEIRAILDEGPLSAQAIAEQLSLSKEGVLKWLRRMEAEGEVAPTSAKRRSKNNTWQLS